MNVIEINDDNFQVEVLQSPVPVLVDVFGEYCGPCRAMRPVVHALANELHGRAKVVEIDVEKSPDLAEELGIAAVPTFVIVKNGEQVMRLVGTQSREKLLKALDL